MSVVAEDPRLPTQSGILSLKLIWVCILLGVSTTNVQLLWFGAITFLHYSSNNLYPFMYLTYTLPYLWSYLILLSYLLCLNLV